MPSEPASDGIAQTVTPKQTHSGCISNNHAHTVRKGIYHVGTNRSGLLFHAQPHYSDRRERTSVQPGRTRTQQPAEYALSRKNHPRKPAPPHHSRASRLHQPQQNPRQCRPDYCRSPPRQLRPPLQTLPQKAAPTHHPHTGLGQPVCRRTAHRRNCHPQTPRQRTQHHRLHHRRHPTALTRT